MAIALTSKNWSRWEPAAWGDHGGDVFVILGMFCEQCYSQEEEREEMCIRPLVSGPANCQIRTKDLVPKNAYLSLVFKC